MQVDHLFRDETESSKMGEARMGRTDCLTFQIESFPKMYPDLPTNCSEPLLTGLDRNGPDFRYALSKIEGD
jgi:hypothetical protein